MWSLFKYRILLHYIILMMKDDSQSSLLIFCFLLLEIKWYFSYKKLIHRLLYLFARFTMTCWLIIQKLPQKTQTKAFQYCRRNSGWLSWSIPVWRILFYIHWESGVSRIKYQLLVSHVLISLWFSIFTLVCPAVGI